MGSKLLIDPAGRVVQATGRTRSGSDQAREGRLVDALAARGDEGRDTLRKASGSREWALIRRYPNGGTHLTVAVNCRP
jgi:hypothetical protein